MNDPKALAKQRATSCMQAIDKVLEEHGCEIRTRLMTEPVGEDGVRTLLSVRWGVVPIPPEK